MPRPTKRSNQSIVASAKGGTAKKRKARSKGAVKKQQQRIRKGWIDTFDRFESLSERIKNNQGKNRTFEENKVLLFAIKAALKRSLDRNKDDVYNTTINWREIESEIARDFCVKLSHVIDLRKGFLEDGDVFVFGERARGQAADGAKVSANQKVTLEMLKAIVSKVDTQHSEGKSVISNNIVALLLDRFAMKIHRVTAGRVLKRIGLSFTPVKAPRRTYAAYRSKAVRDFLIRVDKLEKEDDDDVIKVFTDESYVNLNHSMKNSFMHTDESKGSDLKRKTGKGRRLIILHAITKDGPLCELDDERGYPVDDLI